jgi:hypothetical protein
MLPIRKKGGGKAPAVLMNRFVLTNDPVLSLTIKTDWIGHLVIIVHIAYVSNLNEVAYQES